MGLFDDVIQPQKSGGLFDDVLSPKGQDNPLVRGYQQAKNSALTAGSLLAGNYDQTADLVAENAAYRAANPGTPEGNELMAAWQRGDGIAGGIKEVAGEFARDWREAPNTLGALRATGKNLAAMGGGIVEQMPNMVLPMGGMLAGGVAGSAAGPIGTAAGAFAGATAGNTAMEAGEQVGRALESAGINPGDKAAVKAYLTQHGDEVLGKAATKGAIIGAVDTTTMGIGSKLLSAPARAAADRALAGMGVDMADKAAIKTALSSPEFASRIASDAAFQAAQKGARALGRNAAVASLEPAGEFAGEYLGQGVATGDWDTKGAFLEAASALGQSGATFAGQKLYQAATSPLRNAGKGASEQPLVADLDKANAEFAGAGGMYDQLAAPAARLTHNPEASVIRVPRQDGGETTIDANAGPLSAAAVDAAASGVTEQLQAGTIAGGVPFSSREAAQRILDRREDSDRYVIGPHPRVAGRFSILEKSKSELNALDQANARQTQLAEEEGDGSAQVDAGSNPGQGPVSGGGGGNTSAGASGQGKGIQPAGKPMASGAENSSLGDAGITDAALAGDQSETEVAQPVQQPVSEMPGVKKAAQERAAAARAAAESRGAQIVDEEASAAHPNPTEGQRDAGNYKKGHIKVGGLDISIETPVGATRTGKEGRKKWSVTNTAHYGYIKRSEGADGEQVDVYVKEGTASDHSGPVFVVDQFDPKTGKFDEHKVMLGYRSLIEANAAYDAHFSDRSGPKRRKATVKMGMDEFKAWLKRGDTTAEAAQDEIAQSTGKLSRKRGESQDDYHRRMASEANSRRAARVMPQKERATQSEDVARIAKVIGVSPETVETHAAKDMADSDKQAPNSVSRQTAQFAEEVAKRFGKRIVFFSTTAGTETEGFWQSGNTIFLSTRAGTSHIRLLGHEMLHALRGQASGIYSKMLDAVKGVLTDDELLAQHKDYFGKELEDADALDKPYSGAKTLREFLTEEWMADLSGNRFGEAGFWTEVFTQVENRYGEKSAKGIIARMRVALVGALNKILSAIKGNRFAVDERLGDHLEKIRQALADGFAEYAVAVKQGIDETDRSAIATPSKKPANGKASQVPEADEKSGGTIPVSSRESPDEDPGYSKDIAGAVSRGQAMMSLARRELESVFSGLEAGGLAKKRATEALASHPLKQQIKRVQDNFYDMLFDLEEAGLLSINCD